MGGTSSSPQSPRPASLAWSGRLVGFSSELLWRSPAIAKKLAAEQLQTWQASKRPASKPSSHPGPAATGGNRGCNLQELTARIGWMNFARGTSGRALVPTRQRKESEPCNKQRPFWWRGCCRATAGLCVCVRALRVTNKNIRRRVEGWN